MLHDNLHEMRELLLLAVGQRALCDLSRERSTLHSLGKPRIFLAEAAEMVWRKFRTEESRQMHASILENWCYSGINGAVLESDFVDGQRLTSHAAVKRFLRKTFRKDEQQAPANRKRARPKASKG